MNKKNKNKKTVSSVNNSSSTNNNNNNQNIKVNNNNNNNNSNSNQNENLKDKTKNEQIVTESKNVSKSVIIAGLSVSRNYMSSMFGRYYFVLSGGNVWCDTPDSIVKLKSLIPINLNDLPKVYQSALLSGDRSTWEIPVFSFLLQPICQKLGGQKLISSDIQFISGITDLFNHYTSSGAVFDSTELNDDFDDLTKLLLSVGSNKQEIQSLLSLNIEQNKHSEKKSSILKKNIKEQIKSHNYLEAIKLANEGTNIYGLSVDTLAKFYFYAGYSQEMQRLKTNSKSARDDILLNLSRMKSIKPNWKCTIFMTAVILHNDEKLEEARKTIEMCLSMSPEFKLAKDRYEMIHYDILFGLDTYPEVTEQTKQTLLMRVKDPNLQQAVKYYFGIGVERDPIKSLEYFEMFPNDGDSVLHCGYIYQYRTAYRDLKKALECFKRAYDLGSKEATNQLANCYLNGHGVEMNRKQAIPYLQQSISNGNKSAMNTLGEVYLEESEDGKIEPEKAFEMFLKAANLKPNPNYQSMYNLARLYMKGIGVESDVDAAEMWLKRAMDNGIKDTKDLKGNIQSVRGMMNIAPQFKKIIDAKSNNPTQQSNETKMAVVDRLGGYVNRSKVAAKLWKGRQLFEETVTMIKSGNAQDKDIISNISKCYQIDEMVVDSELLREIFLPILNRYLKDNPMDLDSRYCFIYLKYIVDYKYMLSYTEQTLKDFPNSHLIWNLASIVFGKTGKLNDAIGCNLKARELMAKQKIAIEPSMLYYSAFYKMEKHRETIEFGTPLKNMDDLADMLEFQRICEKDDPLRPRSYYELSSYMIFRNDIMDKAYKYYRMGKESEKDQLPCFLPYKNDKPQLAMFEAMSEQDYAKISKVISSTSRKNNNNNNNKITAPTTSNKNKKKIDASTNVKNNNEKMAVSTNSDKNELENKILATPDIINVDNEQRLRLLLHLRGYFANYFSNNKTNNNNSKSISNQSITIKELPKKSTFHYEEIKIIDFKNNGDWVYRGSYIKGAIIERPLLNNKATHFLIVDLNGSVINVAIYDETINNQATADRLFFVGQKIFIVNPYHRIGSIGIDRISMIRVDQLSEIFTNNTSKPNQLCYSCLEPLQSKPIKCSKCNVASYCSKQCQALDNGLHHKSILVSPIGTFKLIVVSPSMTGHRDLKKAFECFRRAYNLENATNQLAKCYLNGFGV
ncbi:hypothetical protein PPL_06607 [Heterostelium album PN500]|uniref:MYND-type domain-containing protein n=1 Tax=Heterostelium pallidum (strain ATCC 26659 / Pp 5 / PN500) TaxID=670386 RepID=D3BF74_HETP5|nr:hypothetical protein PPL_06607 [Heterostelium album PN500]EFA79788.1 hypothetical protein PPL_06607 [Heterostelium album PN500]|eukprot:XP_020431909.1 hypothetical protein PPL_06607 [Heterostelium album PN500]